MLRLQFCRRYGRLSWGFGPTVFGAAGPQNFNDKRGKSFMNIRLKLVLSAAALAAGCVLLAGCGGSASSASSAASSGAASQSASEPAASVSAEENGASDAVASAVDALLEADPISNQFEITAMNIEYDFGLKADDVTSYKGIKSNDNGDAGLVLAIQPAAGKAQDVMDTLKTYQQDQVAFYGNYAEFAQAQSNVENAIIDGGDDLVVMVIASNDCSSDLTSAGKDILLKKQTNLSTMPCSSPSLTPILTKRPSSEK